MDSLRLCRYYYILGIEPYRVLFDARGLFRTANTLAKTLVLLRKENQLNSTIARYFTLKFLEAKRRYD